VITSIGRFFPEGVDAAAVMMADLPLSILGACSFLERFTSHRVFAGEFVVVSSPTFHSLSLADLGYCPFDCNSSGLVRSSDALICLFVFVAPDRIGIRERSMIEK
jgi:hypothetical protein